MTYRARHQQQDRTPRTTLDPTRHPLRPHQPPTIHCRHGPSPAFTLSPPLNNSTNKNHPTERRLRARHYQLAITMYQDIYAEEKMYQDHVPIDWTITIHQSGKILYIEDLELEKLYVECTTGAACRQRVMPKGQAILLLYMFKDVQPCLRPHGHDKKMSPRPTRQVNRASRLTCRCM